MAVARFVFVLADAQLQRVRGVAQIGGKHYRARVMQITAEMVIKLDLFHRRAVNADLHLTRIWPSQ